MSSLSYGDAQIWNNDGTLSHISLLRNWIFDRYDEDYLAVIHEIRPVRLTEIMVERRVLCPECGHIETGKIPFKADEYMITTSLHDYVCGVMITRFNLTTGQKSVP